MNIPYDPAENEKFWSEIRKIPGFPINDEIPLRSMVFECGALHQLPQVLEQVHKSNTRNVLVVMDTTPMRRGDDNLKPLLLAVLENAGWVTDPLYLQPDPSGQVHTDMHQIEAVSERLKPDQAVVSVGSGVVTDVTKHACYLYQQGGGESLTYIAYQTANSVSAFTSNMAPVFLDGVKRTLPSRYPDALVCDLETLCDAPYEMTAAGVGDLLAAFSGLADWNLACKLGMDSTCNGLPLALVDPLDEILMANADAIRQRTPDGMAVLAKMISLGGLAMSFSHATTPFSGYEHVMSHILDLLNELRQSPLPQHGSQVALASVLVLGAYRDFLADFEPSRIDLEACFPSHEKMKSHIMTEYAVVDPTGKAGHECWSDYSQKLELWHGKRQHVEAFLTNWKENKTWLESLLCPPERLLEILQAVGAPLKFEQLDPPASEADVRFAFLNAPLMRKRLTLGDVLIFFGWDRNSLWEKLWAGLKD
jgi:glycerol-1-phosphate dehydrogenase [NAD(P)+]